MSASATEITNLIYRYAELLDAGDMDSVAGLFAHGRICGVENGPPETVFSGTAGVRKMYEMATRIYEDGTPKTRFIGWTACGGSTVASCLSTRSATSAST